MQLYSPIYHVGVYTAYEVVYIDFDYERKFMIYCGVDAAEKSIQPLQEEAWILE